MNAKVIPALCRSIEPLNGGRRRSVSACVKYAKAPIEPKDGDDDDSTSPKGLLAFFAPFEAIVVDGRKRGHGFTLTVDKRYG